MTKREHPFWAEVAGDKPLPPAAQHLGLRFVEVEPGSGQVRVEFMPREEFTNPRGQVQGGFLAAMLDEALGCAVATTLESDEFAVTLEIKMSCLRPAARAPIIGEGRVIHRGRFVAFLEGALRSGDGELLATATSTVRILERS